MLALCCAGLSVVIVAELGPGLNLTGQQDQAGRVPARLAVPTLTEETFALPPLEEFSEVVERPLFSTDRRPFEPPPPKAAAEQSRKTPRAPVPPPQLSLVGVVITPQHRSALLWDEKQSTFVRAKPGMEVSGWELANVAADGVILRKGETKHSIELKVDKTSKPRYAKGSKNTDSKKSRKSRNYRKK